MDAAVIAALARWPDVPEVYGWLRLDRRGQWRLRDEPVRHANLAAFIGRNYSVDAAGRWFFQNGPQRVFVDLDYTPWVLRLHHRALVRHDEVALGAARTAFLDEDGALLVLADEGIALIDDRDLAAAVQLFRDRHGRAPDEQALEATIGGASQGLQLVLADGAAVEVQAIRRAEVAARFGFVPAPRAPG